MRDEAFRLTQEKERYAPHVRPINEMVDALRDPEGRGWMPYVAPLHGGATARVLSILRDPGPKTLEGAGSGFLCVENDDPTAELQAQIFEQAGITPGDITPWNAYPWYINRSPKATELQAGAEVLKQLLGLMPKTEVVLLQGNEAQDVWRRLLKTHSDAVRDRTLEVVSTYHPGQQALFVRDPEERARRAQHRIDSYQKVGDALLRRTQQP
ncbi:uracil-DNA glycosylase [Streptomyces sp. NBC_00347]|uniref:uracil-DNA glycosylase n=1 Tax=Streptomyces sp. NBC_00347 TaxID=2975721 RepID=UPI0022571671|nr:uracil-DNA glycosylase [Streptomyces sp. NBC_00347]MCX5124605.1 uracil-DNA glycosylase [Streptomyces sp. NBC_00347]